MANFKYEVNVTQEDDIQGGSAPETDTYTVNAQSDAEAKRKAQDIAKARHYRVVRFNWIKRGARVN